MPKEEHGKWGSCNSWAVRRSQVHPVSVPRLGGQLLGMTSSWPHWHKGCQQWAGEGRKPPLRGSWAQPSLLDCSASAVIPGPPAGQWQGLQKAIVISYLGSTSGLGNSLALPNGEMCNLRLVEYVGMLTGSCTVRYFGHDLEWRWGHVQRSSIMSADVTGEVFINLMPTRKHLFTAFFLIVEKFFSCFCHLIICICVKALVYAVLSVPLVSGEMEMKRKNLCLPLET